MKVRKLTPKHQLIETLIEKNPIRWMKNKYNPFSVAKLPIEYVYGNDISDIHKGMVLLNRNTRKILYVMKVNKRKKELVLYGRSIMPNGLSVRVVDDSTRKGDKLRILGNAFLEMSKE